MYQGFEHSKWQLGVAITGVCLLIGGFVWQQIATTGGDRRLQQQQNLLRAVVAQRDDYVARKVTPERQAELTRQVSAFEAQLVPREQFNALLTKLGPSWQYYPETSGAKKPNGEESGTLNYVGSSVADWSSIPDGLDALEALSPSLGVPLVRIASDGDLNTRRFTEIRFGITLRLRD
jgi:hypothetical protein